MAFDIVRFIDVRLDQRDALNTWIAAEQIEDGHPAAAGAYLYEMRHRTGPSISGSSRPRQTRRQGDKETKTSRVDDSGGAVHSLLVSLSPCLLVSLSSAVPLSISLPAA